MFAVTVPCPWTALPLDLFVAGLSFISQHKCSLITEDSLTTQSISVSFLPFSFYHHRLSSHFNTYNHLQLSCFVLLVHCCENISPMRVVSSFHIYCYNPRLQKHLWNIDMLSKYLSELMNQFTKYISFMMSYCLPCPMQHSLWNQRWILRGSILHIAYWLLSLSEHLVTKPPLGLIFRFVWGNQDELKIFMDSQILLVL